MTSDLIAFARKIWPRRPSPMAHLEARMEEARLLVRLATLAASANEIVCQMSVPLADDAPIATEAGDLMVAPAGRFRIHVGRSVPVDVEIDRSSATALNEQLQAVNRKSNPEACYFDFAHKDGAASFWPERIEWREAPRPGVYAVGEYSSAGRDAVEGKAYRTFSPVFSVDDVRGKPAHVICNPNARLNMGGLCNAPAFQEILPIAASEQRKVLDPVADARRKMLRRIKAATIMLNIAGRERRLPDREIQISRGPKAVYTGRGNFLSCCHGHEGCDTSTYLDIYSADADVLHLQVVARDEERDLALLRAWDEPGWDNFEARVQPVPIADNVNGSFPVYALNHLDCWVHSEGKVLTCSDHVSYGVIQTIGDLQQGCSGGPTVNDRGELVGINSHSTYEGHGNISVIPGPWLWSLGVI